MRSFLIAAPAKINLFLDVTSRRADGYHEILSVMQAISLCDEVRIQQCEGGISLECDDPSIPLDDGNLAYRAARLFMTMAGIDAGVKISVKKTIPVSAGLGGGSADAAAVLIGLNDLFDSVFSQDELCRIGACLGADVPFCIVGGCMRAEGIGEVLSELPCLMGYSIIVACPTERISTPSAYGALDSKYNDFICYSSEMKKFIAMERALRCGDLDGMCDNMTNIFESVQDHRSDIPFIKQLMISHGASAAMMSGSGPSVFGVFKQEKNAHNSLLALKAAGHSAFICRPIKKINKESNNE